jgi:bacterioferritin-associated ferredoxin
MVAFESVRELSDVCVAIMQLVSRFLLLGRQCGSCVDTESRLSELYVYIHSDTLLK